MGRFLVFLLIVAALLLLVSQVDVAENGVGWLMFVVGTIGLAGWFFRGREA